MSMLTTDELSSLAHEQSREIADLRERVEQLEGVVALHLAREQSRAGVAIQQLRSGAAIQTAGGQLTVEEIRNAVASSGAPSGEGPEVSDG